MYVRVYVYVCMYVCVCVCVYVCMYVYVFMYVCVCMRVCTKIWWLDADEPEVVGERAVHSDIIYGIGTEDAVGALYPHYHQQAFWVRIYITIFI